LRVLLLTIVLVCTAFGCSDSPTRSDNAPIVSQLQVNGTLRVSGNVGLVFFSFDYADADSDIDRIVYRDPLGVVTNALDDANQSSGSVGVQQAVSMPAAGTEVQFTVSVLDRAGHRSNEVSGSFEAPG
jgi:hypothetical protein